VIGVIVSSTSAMFISYGLAVNARIDILARLEAWSCLAGRRIPFVSISALTDFHPPAT